MSKSTGPFRCTICGLVVERLPDESQQVGKRMGVAQMFLLMASRTSSSPPSWERKRN